MFHLKRMVFFIFIIWLVTGCIGEEQKIVVQKYSKDGNYVDIKEVLDKKQVSRVRNILHTANWKTAKVDMERAADYRFVFQFKNPNIEAKAVVYSVWIGPNKNLLEVTQGDTRYVQLKGRDCESLSRINGQ